MICNLVYKKHVQDCYICAIRPLIYLGFTITYTGNAKCSHSGYTNKPRIEESALRNYLARFLNLFIAIDVLYVAYKLSRSDYLAVAPKYYENLILPNYINTLNFTFCLLINNERYIKYTNGVIALIDKRKFFGIESILTKNITVFLQLWCTFCFFCILAVSILFVVTITPQEISLESVLLAVSMFVNNINAFSFAVYGITTLMIYKQMFNACFDRIHKTITEFKKGAMVSLQKELQSQQQFYLIASSNYKKHVLGFGNVFFYIGQFVFTIFSVVQAYFLAFEVDLEGYWFILFSQFCHIFVAITSSIICVQANTVQLLSQDLISFLYKYPISKLDATEASQVEMLLITLQMEKPIMTASNLFNFGVELLASILGVAITYILVALQFHASFSTLKK